MDPTVDFGREADQMDEEEDDIGLSPEMERMAAQEDRALKPHQEETEVIDLGAGGERR